MTERIPLPFSADTRRAGSFGTLSATTAIAIAIAASVTASVTASISTFRVGLSTKINLW